MDSSPRTLTYLIKMTQLNKLGPMLKRQMTIHQMHMITILVHSSSYHKGDRINARVTKGLRDNNGKPIGTSHNNPILDTRKYEVEFSDGTTAEYYANVIAENLFSQVDSEGHQYVLLKEITDHRSDETAIPKGNGTYRSRNGNMVPKRTTKGWKQSRQKDF